jgi:hypothetical protein
LVAVLVVDVTTRVVVAVAVCEPQQVFLLRLVLQLL